MRLTNSPGPHSVIGPMQDEFDHLERLPQCVRQALADAPYKVAASGLGLDWEEWEMLQAIEEACQRVSARLVAELAAPHRNHLSAPCGSQAAAAPAA